MLFISINIVKYKVYLSFSAMKIVLVTLFLVAVSSAQNGVSTRYWDCCKPSCSWSGKALVTQPVRTCLKDGVTASSVDTASGCNGGTAYTCSNNQPWAVNSTLAYGFAAASIQGGSESTWCCACYQLTFTSGPVVGKKMIVQVTNTGGNLGNNQFDILIPGGGFGLYNGCTPQWGTLASQWGAQYGGLSSKSQCSQLPSDLQPGCHWRFDWFLNADNPNFTFNQVSCPSAITSKTQCIRT